jgi:hypothetical protein
MRRDFIIKAIEIGLVTAPLLGGCSVLQTVTNGVSSTVDGMTNVTSSSTSDQQSSAFVETRFAAIRSEAARGAGEDLDSLAKLLGEPDRVAFARFMKERYTDLFTGLREPRELLARIHHFRSPRPGVSSDA